MPVADIDFTNTEGAGRLKEGTYRARLEKVEEKTGFFAFYLLSLWKTKGIPLTSHASLPVFPVPIR